ncbi:MAG: hypothetical protein JWL90_3186, partial [Chthoniobacteraceae bacterium]|nr:hypothetical protein [Chthoniobacteraceae bacterium]
MRTHLFVLTGMITAAAVHAVGPPAAISTVKPAPVVAPAAPAKEAPPMEDASMSMMGMAAGQAALPKEQVEFFEKKIRPILAESCYKCHSTESGKSKGGLLLDNREVTLKGGENGAAVKPGDPANSLLITAVNYKDKDLQMPPKGEKLSDAQIADLTTWVKMGAPDPRSAPAKGGKLSGLTDKARHHWAYQPVTRPAVPVVQNRTWPSTPVDAFILQKLEQKGMVPSPGADKATLLRRATYDLTGLPPTLEEFNAFTVDESPDAYSKVIDRLLASPHYGERWGRFWLDSARYADTTGDRQNNNNQDYRFPYAWTYRDYVVRAFNEDKPYNRFIIEQLAADKLTDLKDPRDLAALGFLTVGSRLGGANDIINDRIDVVSKGFLGMTVVCARCHDHMFDPIPTKDYYALHGIFASTVEPKEKPIITGVGDKKQHEEFKKKIAGLEQENRDAYYSVVDDNNRLFRQKATAYIMVGYLGRGNNSEENQKRAIALRTSENLAAPLSQFMEGRVRGNDSIFLPIKLYSEAGDNWKATTAAIVENKEKKINPLVAAAFYGTEPKSFDDVAAVYGKLFASVDGKGKEFIQANAAAKAPTDKVTGFEPALMELLQVPFRVSLASTLNSDTIIKESNGWPLQIRGQAKFVFARINETFLTDPGADTRAMVVEDSRQPMDSPVFIRGEAGSRGDIVPRRFLEVLSGGKPTPFKQGSGRLELAQAIANKNNPLTARVIVNRVWLHHFGEGFVRTPDDLGTQSEAPSHPELIDYLSSYLMDQNWSIKKLHKLIMLSKVYQESSFTIKKHEEIDPFNRLLWRANVRRLEFEAVRDSLLVFSGQLDRTVGGQPVNLADEPYSFRRSVYGYIDRGNVPELMSHFDFSNPDMPNSKRATTIVPQQALFLMNSPMAVDITRRILARPEVANAKNNAWRIMALYRIILQR